MSDTTDIGTASTLPVNVQIPGYRLRRQAGSDSIGLWFDVEQESLGRKVTLKILKPQYEQHEAARREFLAEMDRLAALDHPNLPRVLDTMRGDLLVLVIERVGAKTLEALLRPGKSLGVGPSLQHAIGLARALDYLADQGLAHKNVCPSLVAMRDQGGCRLVTFRNVVTLEQLAALKGRLAQAAAYVAPEQLAGEDPVGATAHVYHIGALVFHMVAGPAAARAGRHAGGRPRAPHRGLPLAQALRALPGPRDLRLRRGVHPAVARGAPGPTDRRRGAREDARGQGPRTRRVRHQGRSGTETETAAKAALARRSRPAEARSAKAGPTYPSSFAFVVTASSSSSSSSSCSTFTPADKTNVTVVPSPGFERTRAAPPWCSAAW